MPPAPRSVARGKANFLLSALVLAVPAAAYLAFDTLLKAGDLHAEASARPETARGTMMGLGYHLYIFPAGRNPDELCTSNRLMTLPEEYVGRLATSSVVMINHLLPALTQRLAWPEQGRDIVLVGVRSEVPAAHRNPSKPARDPVAPGRIVLGAELHRSLRLAAGDRLRLLGREFTVDTCHPPRGSEDDRTAWIHLADAQDLLNRPGLLTEIEALECDCADGGSRTDLRDRILALLPGTRIVEVGGPAVAHTEAARQAESIRRAGRETRARREALAAILLPALGALSLAAAGLLAYVYVRARRSGLSRGLQEDEFTRGRLLAALLLRAAAAGLVGGAFGIGAAALLIVGCSERLFHGHGAATLLSPLSVVMVLAVMPLFGCVAAWLPALWASRLRGVACAAVLVWTAAGTPAAEYFVANGGADDGPGSPARPFRTIQRAADVMQPGDTCTVRAGIYREWVKPPRGGNSDARRITYRAAPGELAVVRGSERVTTWSPHTGRLWRAELPDAIFGGFNPFKTNLAGDWLHYGKELHLGGVYLDGRAFREKLSLDEAAAAEGTYWIEPLPQSTALYANFGGADPNAARVEVHVRECVFFPVVPGLGFITVDGLAFEHASANWAAWRSFQRGAVGTYWGRRWIIRNCRIADARCVGLVCGNDASSENTGFDLLRVGGHLVRHNHILRCGQAGIHGFKGWGGSVIEGNLIEDINAATEFGGEETGGIKVHSPVDITIRNNVLRRIHARRVPGRNNDFVAIWIDWAGQGTRVTGNVVYDTEAWALYLQNNHGSPLLVDNNVFAGAIASSSAGCIFAHNLFVNCRRVPLKPYALVAHWKPHTADLAGTRVIAYGHDRWLNNVFIGTGADTVPEGPGVQADWNVFYDGAKPSAWGDRHSLAVLDLKPAVEFVSRADGVDIRLRADRAPREVKCPPVTRDFIGVFALTGQGLEHPDGRPLAIDRDLPGNVRDTDHPTAGPFERLEPTNVFHITAGPTEGPWALSSPLGSP